MIYCMFFQQLANWMLAGAVALGMLGFPASRAEPFTTWPMSAHWPAATDGVHLHEATVTLPTYPYEEYQTAAFDPRYNWPYQQFDYERFRTDAPKPTPRTYRTFILENEYLQITLLPELGGRIWRVIDKASGNDLFYHNEVVKPTPWGPPEMLGWINLGGLEWGLPVVEHGYTWGVPWDITVEQAGSDAATVILNLPDNGQDLTATVRVTLRAGEAGFTVAPTVINLTDKPVRFAYWQNAALAPGQANKPSAETRFVLPTAHVTVHSTDDNTLPATGHSMSWSRYAGRDLSRLGNWRGYLGFFERPAAHGPFVAVYDAAQDAGIVRVYPAATARGSKVFGLGWSKALDSSLYTDDGSAYVELHAGLAPTFSDQVTLGPGESVGWHETWQPLRNIGGVRAANATGAFNWTQAGNRLQIAFQPWRRFAGMLVITENGVEVERRPIVATPDAPWSATITLPEGADAVSIALQNISGSTLIESR